MITIPSLRASACLASTTALALSAAQGAITMTGEMATVRYSLSPWAGSISATDLVNNGQATLSGSVVSNTYVFPGTGVNDGTSADNGVPGGNTFFALSQNNFPGTVTFHLNVSTNTSGYDITSIASFMGWSNNSQVQANQTYNVEVSTVGSAAYTPLTTVSYTPFSDLHSSGYYETRVRITESAPAGILATGVDSIRFTFANPLLAVTNGTGTTEGTLIRELDVHGTPTIPEPSAALLGLAGLLYTLRRRR